VSKQKTKAKRNDHSPRQIPLNNSIPLNNFASTSHTHTDRLITHGRVIGEAHLTSMPSCVMAWLEKPWTYDRTCVVRPPHTRLGVTQLKAARSREYGHHPWDTFTRCPPLYRGHLCGEPRIHAVEIWSRASHYPNKFSPCSSMLFCSIICFLFAPVE
jgi:hypothetical protein